MDSYKILERLPAQTTYFPPSQPLTKVVHHYEWVHFNENLSISEMNLYPSFGMGLHFYFWSEQKIIVNSDSINGNEILDTLILPPCVAPISGSNLGNFDLLRVVFHIGMMYTLFDRQPMSIFCGHMLDPCTELDDKLIEIYDRMLYTDEPLKKMRILDTYLLSMLRGRYIYRPIFPALNKLDSYILGKPLTVNSIADELAISRQQLTRLTKTQLGYSAKQALSILRFNRSLTYLHSGKCCSLAQAAVELGYFDQAHFTHEFKRYSQITPYTYLKKLQNIRMYGAVDDFLHSGMTTEHGS